MSAAPLIEALSLARVPGLWSLPVVAGTAMAALAALDLSGRSLTGKVAA